MKIILVNKLRFKEFEGNWKTKCVIDLASKLNVGFVGTCEPFYTSSEEGVLLVRTGNLKGVKILLDEEKYVTKEFHSKNKKSQIKNVINMQYNRMHLVYYSIFIC